MYTIYSYFHTRAYSPSLIRSINIISNYIRTKIISSTMLCNTANPNRPTEECSLTKALIYKHEWRSFCGSGLKFIVSSFAVLTIAVTATLILQLSYTDNAVQGQTGLHGAVASDYTNCSQIGTKVLRKGGNAIDAAVAATICMTVVAPHKTGLGGGGVIMTYSHKVQSTPTIVDFASETLKDSFSTTGIRVPAILKGLEFVHELKGRLSWADILSPSISLANDGFVVTKELASETAKNSNYEAFYGHLNAGDILKLPELAETLALVAQHGTDALYNGTLSQKILESKGNYLDQLYDLANYRPQMYNANRTSFYGHTLYYPPHKASFTTITKALEDIKAVKGNASLPETEILVARILTQSIEIPAHIVETVEKERYTGVTVMDWEDTYVCILTGLAAPFGSGHLTSAGFFLDSSDDANNFETFLPVIFHKENTPCGLRGVFGTDDILVTGQLLYNIIVKEMNVSIAIENPRYYFFTDGLGIEDDQENSINSLIPPVLTSVLTSSHSHTHFPRKSVNAIIKKKDSMMSHSDSRGGGLASRF